MFANHPQTPLSPAGREAFQGLAYFDYDPAYRVTAAIEPLEAAHYDIAGSGPDPIAFTRFGKAAVDLPGGHAELELYWLDGYGGGLFLPFRDATAPRQTYGAGRYLLDTVKGADLGAVRNRLVLDFNFSYHPSCAYDDRWACPLAPPPNRLTIPVSAGEKLR